MNPHDIDIDRAIVESLYNSGVSCLSNSNLKEATEQNKLVNRTLSDDTFNLHLRKLSDRIPKIISKEYDPQRNRPERVFYSLTPYAKIRYTLKLPVFKTISSFSSPPEKGKGSFSSSTLAMVNAENKLMELERKGEIQEHAYNLFFTFAVFNPRTINYQLDKAGLSKLLSKLHSSIDNLIISNQSEHANHITICYYPIENVDIYAVRDLKTGDTFYYCRLLGASVSEFFDEVRIGNIFSHIHWKRESVKAYLESLYSNQQILGLKIIEKFISPLDGNLRFYIPDKSLNAFLSDSWILFGVVYMRMKYVWKRSKMNREHLEWLERLYGCRESKRQHYDNENSRKDLLNGIISINPLTKEPLYFRSDEEKEQYKTYMNKLIKDLDKEIVYRYSDLLLKYKDTMDNYHFITKYLINEIIYPRFLRLEHKVKATR